MKSYFIIVLTGFIGTLHAMEKAGNASAPACELTEFPMVLAGEYNDTIWKDQNKLRVVKSAYITKSHILKPAIVTVASNAVLTLDESECYEVDLEPNAILYLVNRSLVQKAIWAKKSLVVNNDSKIIDKCRWVNSVISSDSDGDFTLEKLHAGAIIHLHADKK